MEVADAVEEVESCSACYGYLIPALDRLKEEGILEKLNTKICIGQGYRGKTGTDMDKVMRDKKIPLFALESQDPVKDFDFLGITIQYEMCYTNILQILDLSGIPLLAEKRTWDDPIVIGGGPCTYNPEPLAQFFDIFYIGEGETVYFQLMDLYKEEQAKGSSRLEFL